MSSIGFSGHDFWGDYCDPPEVLAEKLRAYEEWDRSEGPQIMKRFLEGAASKIAKQECEEFYGKFKQATN